MGPSDLIYETFMLLFSFSIFSDRRSLKIENENNSMKTLTAVLSPTYRTRVPRVQFINIETYPAWPELPLTGAKPVRATEVLLYIVHG